MSGIRTETLEELRRMGDLAEDAYASGRITWEEWLEATREIDRLSAVSYWWDREEE